MFLSCAKMTNKMSKMFLSTGLVILFLFQAEGAASKRRNSGKADAGPPPFFLQDSTDGMCLSGEGFKRCAIDTLFYVVGSPGSYQIHKRPIGSGEISKDKSDDDSADATVTSNNDDDVCISKKSCSPADVKRILPTKLTKCSHCGAKSWNILGDASTGYVLSENDGETCLFRSTGNRAVTAPCDTTELTYTPLQLQFATNNDITIMKSPGAQLITAAADGDLKRVEKLLNPPKDDDGGDVKGVDVNSRDWDDLTALTPAAANGHFDIVKFLIDNGADVNLSDKDGITPLMEASIMGHTEIAEYLLEEGATADAKASSGVTALWLAAGEGKLDVVTLLLSKGQADPSNVRSDGITALMTASANGHVSTVKLLLEEGADASISDSEGLTPLMNAAESGKVDVMHLLVESIPDETDESGVSQRQKYVDVMSDTGFTAVIVAAAHGNTDAIQYLVAPADGTHSAAVDLFHETGVTALMYAAAGNHTDATKALLENGADANILHSNGGSALLEASTAGSAGSLRALMDHGAKVDLIDNDGVTPLMSAASQGHMETISMLVDAIEANPDIDFNQYMNLLSHSGGSAIMFSAGGGHVDATEYLLGKGAEINAIAQATPEYLVALKKALEDGTATEEQKQPHVDGVTALHVAAEGGHLDCVKFLLNSGAINDIKDDRKRTPLTMSIKGNYGKVASELVRHGSDPNTKYIDPDGVEHDLLMDALIVENVEFATLLIENGASLYHVDEHNVSTLLQAAHRGLETVVKELLGKNAMDLKDSSKENIEAVKAYLNLPSDEGITPLIAAASEVHPEIVSNLIAAGAEVNAVDKDGTSALMAAAAKGNIEAVEQLLQAKAEVNLQNVDGHTALMFAYNGKTQVETLWERYHQYVDESKVTSTPETSSSSSSEDDAAGSERVVSTKDLEVEDGGSGSVIKEALEKHKNLVQLLLKYGADETYKDKEGHTAKDFDFHPEMDSEVLKQEEMAEKRRDNSKNEL